MNSFQDHLARLCAQTGIPISSGQLKQMTELYETLLEENAKTNLTRITDPEEAALKHFVDSIVPYAQFSEGAKVIDIGSGAGFPALPLSIMRPDLQITALEAVEKKCAFIRAAAEKCGVRITVLNTRAEEQALGNERASYDACVTRAVANLRVLLELCAPFIRIGGKVYCYKADYAEELAASGTAERKLGLRLKQIMDMPEALLDHHILVFEKIAKTPSAYPRRFAKIKKAPL